MLSEEPRGKIGMFGVLYHGNEEELRSIVTPQEEIITSGTRILMCTDGVLEYLGKKSVRETRLAEIGENLKCSESLEKAITQINALAAHKLKLRNETIQDDYTIVALEVK